MERVRYQAGTLTLRAKGSSVGDCSPLTVTVGDRSYAASVVLEISGGAQGGLVLFYNERCFCGVGFNTQQMFTYNYGEEQSWMRQTLPTKVVHVRVTNRSNVVTFHYSHDGTNWTQHPWQMEVSGFHHNVFGGFLSLKVGIFCAGQGEIAVKRFSYRAIPAAPNGFA
jgi:xylan 1,4-beta-xylosidase